MSSQRLFIRNGHVVSMDPDVGDVPHGDVLVEDGKIAEIGRSLEVSEAEEIDATGMIVMPGFVDTGTRGKRRCAACSRVAPWTTTSRSCWAASAAITGRKTCTSGTTRARSKRSTAASRRCSTGHTSTTHPITPMRRSRD